MLGDAQQWHSDMAYNYCGKSYIFIFTPSLKQKLLNIWTLECPETHMIRVFLMCQDYYLVSDIMYNAWMAGVMPHCHG